METRANYVIVGIFTLVAILAAFGFVYWTAAIGDRGETALLRVRIPGSASGLGRGSFVLFNGVKVGDVKRVYIDVDNPTVAIAETQVDRITPITKSTQADIGLAGLTGQANIEMKGADPREPKLLDQAEAEGKVAEITANPSAVTNLLQSAQNIFTRADKVVTQLEGFTQDTREPLTQTIHNVQKFSDALAKNTDGIRDALEEIRKVSANADRAAANIARITDKVANRSDDIEQTIKDARQLADRLNKASTRVDGILAKVDTLLGSGEANGIMADARATLKSYKQVADTLNSKLGTITDNLARFSGKGLQNVEALVQDGRRSINRIEEAVTDLQRNPQRILSGGEGEVRQYDGRARR